MAEIPAPLTNREIPKGTGRIFRNVLSNWGSYGFTLVVNFFLSPFVVHHLGNTGYGVWTLIVSLTGYLGLLDMGVRGAVTRYVAKFHTRAEDENAGGVASSALMIFGVAGLVAILISVVLAVFAVGAFHIPDSYRTTARIVLILAGANVAVSLVSGVFGGIVVALQRFELLNILDVVVTALRVAFTVAALRNGKGLIVLACIQLLCAVLRGLGNVMLSYRLYPHLHIGLSKAARTHVRMIFSFSVYVFLIHIGTDLIYYTDSVVIGAFLPVSLITFFTIGGSLLQYSRGLISGISQTMSPLASTLEAQNDLPGLQKALLTSSRFATMVSLPILVTFMLRGGTFIGLWMGPQYAGPSGQVLWILSSMMLFHAAIYPVGSILLGISKHKPLVPARMAEGLCNLGLSILWVRTMGIAGVAWGTTVPGIAFTLLFWPWYLRRTLAISPLTFAISSWVRPGVAILPFVFCTYTVERLWQAPNLITFFLQVAAVLPVALVCYWLFCFTRDQRQSYSRHLAQSMAQLVSRS